MSAASNDDYLYTLHVTDLELLTVPTQPVHNVGTMLQQIYNAPVAPVRVQPCDGDVLYVKYDVIKDKSPVLKQHYES